jgi:hypothetical protein
MTWKFFPFSELAAHFNSSSQIFACLLIKHFLISACHSLQKE